MKSQFKCLCDFELEFITDSKQTGVGIEIEGCMNSKNAEPHTPHVASHPPTPTSRALRGSERCRLLAPYATILLFLSSGKASDGSGISSSGDGRGGGVVGPIAKMDAVWGRCMLPNTSAPLTAAHQMVMACPGIADRDLENANQVWLAEYFWRWEKIFVCRLLSLSCTRNHPSQLYPLPCSGSVMGRLFWSSEALILSTRKCTTQQEQVCRAQEET